MLQCRLSILDDVKGDTQRDPRCSVLCTNIGYLSIFPGDLLGCCEKKEDIDSWDMQHIAKSGPFSFDIHSPSTFVHTVAPRCFIIAAGFCPRTASVLLPEVWSSEPGLSNKHTNKQAIPPELQLTGRGSSDTFLILMSSRACNEGTQSDI